MNQKKIVTLLLPGYTTGSVFEADQSLVSQTEFSEPDPIVHDLSVASHENSGGASTIAHLQRAFSFSQSHHQTPRLSQLASILGFKAVSGADIPGAWLDLHGDTQWSSVVNNSMQSGLVKADPIYLKAGRDSATLVSPAQLQLTDSEADEMLAAINSFLVEDGLRFFRRGALEWYMSGMSAEALRTYPTSFLANRNASSFLPDGVDAAGWKRLMTEIQMLLHSLPVNQQREARGLMPVNSVWFWGGSSAPEIREQTDVIVYCDDPQAIALAVHANAQTQPLHRVDSFVQQPMSASQSVILDTSLFEAWLGSAHSDLSRELTRINTQWLLPLANQVRTGQLDEVVLLTEDGLHGVCNPQVLAAAVPAFGFSWWKKRALGFFKR